MRKKPLGAFTPNYNLLDPVREFMKGSLPKGAYQKADGVLHISLTTLDGFKWPVNRVVSQYGSDQELEEVRGH